MKTDIIHYKCCKIFVYITMKLSLQTKNNLIFCDKDVKIILNKRLYDSINKIFLKKCFRVTLLILFTYTDSSYKNICVKIINY